jgi:hypothetical protein
MAYRNDQQCNIFAGDLRQQRAQQLLERDTRLKEVLRLEPRFGEVIREITALLTTSNRERAYCHFKQQCEQFVGEGASHEEIRTPAHYTAVMTFIHTLMSWVEERPLEGEANEPDDPEELIAAAVRRSVAASREASLQLFKECASAQQVRLPREVPERQGQGEITDG